MSQQTQYKTYEGQSLYDVAAAVLGDASYAIDIAIANGISVTGDLQAGQILAIPEGKIKANVLQVYNSAGIIPATEASPDDTIILPDGIGFMAIGSTFIVR